MFRLPQLSLSSGSFYSALIVITVLGVFIGTFWAFNEYESYQKSIANIRFNYQQRYQKRVKEELEKVIDFVAYKKSQQNTKIEEEIRDKVQSAYSIAAHMYSLYKEEKSIDELRQMVVELLRPIRWDSGLGYYFAGRVSTGTLDLFADKPQYEGVAVSDIPSKNWQEVVSKVSILASNRGAGKIEYQWTKPETPGTVYKKISFVKHFSPFDWFIGAGVYADEMEARIQKDILERLEQISFGSGGEVLVFRENGTIICSRDRKLLGRTVADLVDTEKAPYGSEMLAVSKSEDGFGFLEYAEIEEENGKISRRLGYVQKYQDWNWVFAASISMAEMEAAITHETRTYEQIAFKNTTLFMILFIIAVSFLLLLSYFYSKKISNSITLFTEFFRKSADSKVRIEKNLFGFKEFAVLGEYANRMNEDRLEKEQLIKRDERRLDTLHQIGIMENSSLLEIYDFALARIAEITLSEAGYFVVITDGYPILKSQVVRKDGELQQIPLDSILAVEKDHVIMRFMQNSQAGIMNTREESPATAVFPIDGAIQRRVDVPIFENNRIVAIMGLCNKDRAYGENDFRQISLLLEGVWLHITRMVNRKEMRGLRQLLKNITDSMPSMLIGIDSDIKIMQWNRLAESKTGVSAEQAGGACLFDILPRLKRHQTEIETVIVSGSQTEIRRDPVVLGNEKQYETITIFPIVHDGSKGAVLRLDDVTELVRMEDLMIQSEKMLSVGGLAAGIAHEINNPLASVIQNLQVTQNRLSTDLPKNISVAEELGISFSAIQRYIKERGIDSMLDAIGHDSRRAAKLVHNMLAFSRKSQSVFVLSDLRKLLDNALTLGLADYDLKKNYDFKQICVDKDYDNTIREVNCEETNIQQVFLNIIRNAAHAIAENSNNIEVPTLVLRVKNEGNMARVELEDNGTGIDAETRKRIFEPFFTTKGVGKGTGLGLSISYFIINDQHHGTLEVSSEPGKGSIFIIRLPFEKIEET